VLISEATLVRAGEGFWARELALLRVAGREEPVRVFELMATKATLDPQKTRRCELFRMALKAYRARDFASAKSCFAEALTLAPDDGPAQHFLARVTRLEAEPPPDHWTGV
jgi:adenylate cyclase